MNSSYKKKYGMEKKLTAQAPVPLKEETTKMDEDGFQTVPARGAKEVWRPRRGRA